MERDKILLDRNLMGIEFEKKGNVDKAIELYELNIAENFDGNHPYDRLVVIYRKRKMFEDAIRVLKKAIYVFENVVYRERGDRIKKLDKFRTELTKLSNIEK